MIACLERADLFALVCDVLLCFLTFTCGILGQVWYLIVSIPDLCHFSYFQYQKIFSFLTEVQWDISDLPFAQNKDCQYYVSHLNIWRWS